MVSPKGTASGAHWMRTLSIAVVAAVALLMMMPTGALFSSAPAKASAAVTPAQAALSVAATAPAHSPLSQRLAAVDPALANAQRTSPSAALTGAIHSLALGLGPANGVPQNCVATSGLAGHCALPSHSSRPAVTPGVDGWQNATIGAGAAYGSPQAAWGASMAWDNFDNALIYYGGCGAVCPSNSTWAYIFGYWENISFLSVQPPAVYDASMTYDHLSGYIVLFGGCGNLVCPDNETWEFAAGYWYNVSAPFCIYSSCLWAPSPRMGSSMAFANDTLDNITVLFGGCIDYFCYGTTNQTYEWYGPAAAWIPVATSTAPSPRAFSAMADLPGVGILLFGGCTSYYGSCSLNDTWIFYNGTWTNESPYLSFFGFANPGGRAGASMTWDAQLNEALLIGGYSSTTYYNDTWAWACPYFCGWYDVSNSMDIPSPTWDMAMSSEAGPTWPAIVFGGECSCVQGFARTPWTFVYETPVLSNPIVTPLVGPTRSAVSFVGNLSGGGGGYFGVWSTGDGGSTYDNASHNYSRAGVFQANLTAWDRWGVSTYSTVSVTITGVAAVAQAAPAMTDLGNAITFSTAAATGGTSPYNYTWAFGDATTGWGLSVAHTYAAVGTYTATLTVNDTHGAQTNSSVTVQVVAAPAVTFTASVSTIDAGGAITFTPTPTGGSSPYTYAWTFGDGTTSSATAPTHTYTTAGTYHVNVTLTDAIGLTATHSLSVTVNPKLSAQAVVSSPSVKTGTAVWFNATALGGTPAYTYSWVFGDGGHATTASASHSFTTAGTYTAHLWVNDSVGGAVVVTVSVTVTAAGGGGGGGSSSSSSSLPSWIWYAVIGLIVVAVVVVALAMMMRRKKPGAGTSAPPSGAAGGAPPSGAMGGSSPPPPGGST